MRAYIEPLWQRWVEFRGKQALIFMFVFGLVFLVISYAVRRPGAQVLDEQITHAIQSVRWPGVHMTMLGFTALGDSLTLCLVAGAVAAYLFYRRRPLAATLTICTLFGLLVNMALKEWVGRPRPSADIVSVLAPTIGLSFPSGHAMASTMLYGFLGVLCWMHIPSKSGRWRSMILFIITAVMVSVSRIYLGAHWFSDVVGGWVAGIFCLMLLTEIYKHWGKRELEMHKVSPWEPEIVHFVREQPRSQMPG